MSKKVYSLDDILNNSAAEFELGKRRFVARPMSLTETLMFEKAEPTADAQMQVLAPIMSARATDKKEVTADWLSDHLTIATGNLLVEMLRTGEVPGDPKA